MHTRLVLIDGNPLMYRAYHSPGTRHLTTSTGRKSGGFYGLLKIFLALRKRLKLSHYVMCFDMGASWRNDVSAAYKTHGNGVKPEGFLPQLEDAQAFLHMVGVPVYKVPLLEADDLIGVFASEWVRLSPTHTVIIVSSDRDYFQLVSDRIMLYDDKAKKFYGPQEVEDVMGVALTHVLHYRCLVGDKSDGLRGVPGYGPKRAREFCSDPEARLMEFDRAWFTYNRHLMQLPRHPFDLQVSIAERKRLHTETNKLMAHLLQGLTPTLVRPGLAQELLDTYECRSIQVNDFLPHSIGATHGHFSA